MKDIIRSTIRVDRATIDRLRRIGGTLSKGLYLASFADGDAEAVARLIRNRERYEHPPAPKPEKEPLVRVPKVRPPTQAQRNDPTWIMEQYLKRAILAGFDEVWWRSASDLAKWAVEAAYRRGKGFPLGEELAVQAQAFEDAVARGDEEPLPIPNEPEPGEPPAEDDDENLAPAARDHIGAGAEEDE